MIIELKDRTVGEIVADDYRTAFVFKSFGIDYCCGGKRTISKACSAKGVDVQDLDKELQAVLTQPADGLRFKDWSASFLIDYIINNHHSYVQNKLPELTFLADKVARVHGEEQPELVEMRQLVFELNEELLAHLKKEELLSFPLIKDLESGSYVGDASKAVLKDLEEEHEEAGDLLKTLESLSNGFTPPEGACTSYVIYFKLLKEFQEDLHKHVHLENNLLFPKVDVLVQSKG